MIKQLILLSFALQMSIANAHTFLTERIPQFANNRVTVWQTVIYPSANQILKTHRHDHDRIVVALNNGLLKVMNNKGESHYLKLEKHKAYYLAKDTPGETHTDENMTRHPIKVLVIELNS